MIFSHVLIWVMSGSIAGVTGSTMFQNEKSCEQAAKILRSKATASNILVFCTEVR